MLKHHTFRLTFASLILLVSLTYGLPHIYSSHKLGNNYFSLLINKSSSTGVDELTLYAPAVKYILQGHIFLRDVYVFEYDGYPTPFIGESIPSIVMAFLSKITGTVDNAFIAADFIYPAIIFVLLYVFSSYFIKNRYFALITAFTASVSRDFIATIPNPFSMINYFKFGDSHNELLYLSRSFHPQATFAFFLISVILLVNLIKRPSLKTTIILGISFGLLFYTYIFYWTYFLALIIVVLLYFMIKKDFRLVKFLAMSILIGLTIGFFYFREIFYFYSLSLAKDFTEKFTMPDALLSLTLFRYVFIALLMGFVILVKKGRKTFPEKDLIYFYIILILVGIFFPLASKLIGKDLEAFHYIRRGLMPFATVALFLITYYLFRKKRFILNLFAIVLFITFLTFGLSNQIKATKKIQINQPKDRDLQAVFNWFNGYTQRNSVIGSVDTNFNLLIPVYTANKVYFPPTYRSIMPTNEEFERYAILSNLLGIEPTVQKKNLDKNVSYIFSFQSYNQQKHKFEILSEKRIPIESQLDDLYRTELKGLIKKYHIDYIVITPGEMNSVSPQYNLLKPVTSVNGYLIFKVI